MNDLAATHERLIDYMKTLIQTIIDGGGLPTKIRKGAPDWSWLPANKKYRGSLWFHTCEPSPTCDHTFYVSIGRSNVRLLEDGVTLVIRSHLDKERRHRLEDLGDPRGYSLFSGYVSNLIYKAFWQEEPQPNEKSIRPPRKRLSPSVRRARRQERRRLRSVCRKK
jgi:hypothetical protein